MDGNELCPGRQLYALRRCRGVSPIVYAGLVGLEERSAFLGVLTELRSLGVSPKQLHSRETWSAMVLGISRHLRRR